MPLHCTLASEPPAARHLRRCAPLLLLLGMLAGLLLPGLNAGDRPFQTSLCDDLEHVPIACAPRADFDYAARPFVHAKHELHGSAWIGARTYASQLKNS